MGPSAIQDPQFYSSLHQKVEEKRQELAQSAPPADMPDFSGSEWDLIRASAGVEDTTSANNINECSGINLGGILEGIDEFAQDMKARVTATPLVAQGIETFLRRYREMKACNFATARLSSALHRFGWVFGGSIRSTQGGHLRRGRRIPVNSQAAPQGS